MIKVHLKGTFAPAHHAAAYWRDRNKATGEQVGGRIINTSSVSGIYGNVGQTNYGAAKMGIAGFTIIASRELRRYGVTVNAIAPGALTRLTEDLGGPITEERRISGDPKWVAPIAVWLASEQSADVSGRMFEAERQHLRHRRGLASRPDRHADPGPARDRRARRRDDEDGAQERRHERPGPRLMYLPDYAAATPDKPAMISADTGEVLTFGELNEASNRMAQLLHARGLAPRRPHRHPDGEQSPLHGARSGPAFRSGLYVTTVNRYLPPDEAAYIVNDCGAKASSPLMTSARRPAGLLDLIPELPDPPDGRTEPSPGWESYEDALAACLAGTAGRGVDGRFHALQLRHHRPAQGHPAAAAAS